MQFFQFVVRPKLLVSTYTALMGMSFCLGTVSLSRPELQSSSQSELTDVLHLVLDWP